MPSEHLSGGPFRFAKRSAVELPMRKKRRKNGCLPRFQKLHFPRVSISGGHTPGNEVRDPQQLRRPWRMSQ